MNMNGKLYFSIIGSIFSCFSSNDRTAFEHEKEFTVIDVERTDILSTIFDMRMTHQRFASLISKLDSLFVCRSKRGMKIYKEARY